MDCFYSLNCFQVSRAASPDLGPVVRITFIDEFLYVFTSAISIVSREGVCRLTQDSHRPLSRMRNHLAGSLKPAGFKLRGLIPYLFLRLFQLPDHY
jgi:hypothetical protein